MDSCGTQRPTNGSGSCAAVDNDGDFRVIERPGFSEVRHEPDQAEAGQRGGSALLYDRHLTDLYSKCLALLFGPAELCLDGLVLCLSR